MKEYPDFNSEIGTPASPQPCSPADGDFATSSVFSGEEHCYQHMSKRGPRVAERGHLTENIQSWLENAKMYPHAYDDKGYDPNDFSVEEWETWLKAQNNNLTLEQWFRRSRWKLSPRIVYGFGGTYVFVKQLNLSVSEAMSAYVTNFETAHAVAHEFLSDTHCAYVYTLIEYLHKLAMAVDDSRDKLEQILQQFDVRSPQVAEARKNHKDCRNRFIFACKYKSIAVADLPADLKEVIVANITKTLVSRRRRWRSGGEAFDLTKILLYRRAVAFGFQIVLPVDDNTK